MSEKHADVTLHIVEELNADQQLDVVNQLLANNGVLNVRYRVEKPHLLVAEYNPDDIQSGELLQIIEGIDLHGQLIGF